MCMKCHQSLLANASKEKRLVCIDLEKRTVAPLPTSSWLRKVNGDVPPARRRPCSLYRPQMTYGRDRRTALPQDTTPVSPVNPCPTRDLEPNRRGVVRHRDMELIRRRDEAPVKRFEPGSQLFRQMTTINRSRRRLVQEPCTPSEPYRPLEVVPPRQVCSISCGRSTRDSPPLLREQGSDLRLVRQETRPPALHENNPHLIKRCCINTCHVVICCDQNSL